MKLATHENQFVHQIQNSKQNGCPVDRGTREASTAPLPLGPRFLVSSVDRTLPLLLGASFFLGVIGGGSLNAEQLSESDLVRILRLRSAGLSAVEMKEILLEKGQLPTPSLNLYKQLKANNIPESVIHEYEEIQSSGKTTTTESIDVNRGVEPPTGGAQDPTTGSPKSAGGSKSDARSTPKELEGNTPPLGYLAFISSGARFQNPYVIKYDAYTGDATLENTGDTTKAFLAFSYYNRWVLRTPFRDQKTTPRPDADTLIAPWRTQPDITGNVGFTFLNQSESNTYTASNIAGSGDFYADVNFGFPFLRWNSLNQNQQLSLEISGGVETDKQFQAVHPNSFVGLSYQTAFRPLDGRESTAVSGLFVARFGYGWVDYPVLTDTTTTSQGVKVSGGLPEFEMTGSPAFGVTLLYPLLEGVFLTVGATGYLKDNPTPWSVSIGASMPIGKLTQMFEPLYKQ